MSGSPRRRGGRLRSFVSMVLGAVLMVGGFGLRSGAFGAFAGGSPGPSDSAPSNEPAAGDPTAPPIGEGSLEPSYPVDLFFADAFDVEGAWPTGADEFISREYDTGQYVMAAVPTDLPVYTIAATGGVSAGPNATVEATVWLASESTTSGIGIVAGDGLGLRFALMLDAVGHVALLRDSIESLDLLGSGTVEPGAGPRRLVLSVSSTGTTAFVDGALVSSTAETFEPSEFGLATWATETVSTFRGDDYQVRLGAD